MQFNDPKETGLTVHGVPRKQIESCKKGRIFTTEEIEIAQRMAANGLSIANIAKFLGCSRFVLTRNMPESELNVMRAGRVNHLHELANQCAEKSAEDPRYLRILEFSITNLQGFGKTVEEEEDEKDNASISRPIYNTYFTSSDPNTTATRNFASKEEIPIPDSDSGEEIG